MKNEKIEAGDWVITDFTLDNIRGVKKIITLAKDGWSTFQNEDGSIEASPYTIIELWQPKEDDYIWDSHYRTLGKVTFSDGVTVSYIDVLNGTEFEFETTAPKNCSPFFGKLPDFAVTPVKSMNC
jgi:hypothetical protein